MTKSLGAPEFVSGIFASGAESLEMFLPVIVFLVAALLAFSTGTSWGSFGILLPIVVGVSLSGELLVIAVSACLAGAVCGDHCSPISDTTIMSSAGAQSNHINHVVTQLPYVLLVAAISAVGYILAGILQNALSVLAICFGILIVILGFIRFYNNKQQQ